MENGNPWEDTPSHGADEPEQPVEELIRTPEVPPPISQITPSSPTRTQMTPLRKLSKLNGPVKDLVFGVCIVNFHHLRGPEIEYSKVNDGCSVDLAQAWPYLSFQALPDGAHSFKETFAYFTLSNPEPGKDATLFGISCARQIKVDELLEKTDDVTRSSVQKSLVVILRQPIYGQIKEKLGIVTRAFFNQKNFSDTSIVDALYQNLKDIYCDDRTTVDESEFYAGISLRELLKDYRKDVLVVLKAMLLEKKVAFYGSNPTSLCVTEYAFISLIPNLINNLLDSSSTELNHYAETLEMTTSFQMSDRNSMISFAGLPLQIFGKGGVFSPYSPLQQFDDLKHTHHCMFGTSNALILNQKSQMCDVFINLDNKTVEVLNPDLVQPLQLTSYDKKWMSHLSQSVLSSWGDSYSGFVGSDDYIRWQFEDYLTGLLSTVKYNNYISKYDGVPPTEPVSQDYDATQLKHFNVHFVEMWRETLNYHLFEFTTDDHIFDVFEPKHIHADEIKTLGEKFQIFKTENSKRFEEYRKGLRKEKAATDTETNDEEEKKASPAKLWGWYSKRKDA